MALFYLFVISMRTFINWSGNKSKHINKFIKYIPKEYNTYIEPFVGSGAVLLKLEPEKWIINDYNKDLISIWNTVKSDPIEIIKSFKNFGKNFKILNKENKLKKCKKLMQDLEFMKYKERAITYLLLKFCAYMGNIIINNKFYFPSLDLPILSKNYLPFLKDNYYNNLLQVSEFLNEPNGKIYNRDYKNILNKAQKGDFVFMDPPYVEDHGYQFNYNKNEVLDNIFILELYKECKKLDEKNVKWLMTQANTKEIRKIFKEYKIKTFDVYRPMKKLYVKELVIMNY